MRRQWTAAWAIGFGLLLSAPGFAQSGMAESPSIAPEENEEGTARGVQRQYIVIGQIESIDLDSDTVRIRNSQTDEVVPIVVPESALVSMNGEAIPLEEVPTQADALASFTEQGDELVARSLAVSAPDQKSGEGKPPQGGMDQGGMEQEKSPASPNSPDAPNSQNAPDAGSLLDE